MLLTCIKGFGQECPCVRAAVIGTHAKSSSIQNKNKTAATDNIIISLGEKTKLYVKNATGKIIWYKNEQALSSTWVAPTETTEFVAHRKIIGYYGSIRRISYPKRTREWLSTKSFKYQYDFGIKTLKEFGWYGR